MGDSLLSERLFDFAAGEADFLALHRIGQHEHFTFFAKQQARDDTAAGRVDERGAEGLVDIAAGIERVFEQAIKAAQTRRRQARARSWRT